MCVYRFIVKTPQKQGAYFPGETLSIQSSLTQDLTMDDGKLRVFPWHQYFFSHRGKETRHTTFIEDFPTHYLNINIACHFCPVSLLHTFSARSYQRTQATRGGSKSEISSIPTFIIPVIIIPIPCALHHRKCSPCPPCHTSTYPQGPLVHQQSSLERDLR